MNFVLALRDVTKYNVLMTTTNETVFGKLPRTKRAMASECSADDCILCGEILADIAWFVVTDQGDYPIGAKCAKRAQKAGFEVVPA